jgi:ubiquinone/menaquinone biosynthesis C-methylase UbiE
MPLAVGGDTATPHNRSLRLAIMAQHIACGNFVLDVGCGRGEYLLGLLECTPNALGIDTAEKKLEDCWTQHPKLRQRALQVSADAMPFPSGQFDVVIVNEVLEHIPNQDGALREIWRVLKPGGKLLLFCPNRFYPFETHGLLIRGTLRKWLPFLHYLPPSLASHFAIEAVARNYWPKEATQLLESHGFCIQQLGFVPQTFENISRSQPALIGPMRPLLRGGVAAAAKLPLIRVFVSVSTFLMATKDVTNNAEIDAHTEWPEKVPPATRSTNHYLAIFSPIDCAWVNSNR